MRLSFFPLKDCFFVIHTQENLTKESGKDNTSVTSKTMPISTKITPFLWFDGQAEEAANFYTGIFPNSKILSIHRYPRAGTELHGRNPGSVMTVVFELDGLRFIGLNGGPEFKFDEAISFSIDCKDQDEVDYYWDRLGESGEEKSCGWLSDRFGLCWQVVPNELPNLIGNEDREGANRAMNAMLKMKKLDIHTMKAAFAAKETAGTVQNHA